MDSEIQILKLIQKNLLYMNEGQRRRTFKKWIFTEKQPCSAVKMAEAGFIFIGDKDSPDTVKCFFCDKILDGWDPTDDPWREHIDHSPSCMFAKFQKPTELLTLKDVLHIRQELVKKAVNKEYDRRVELVEEQLNEIENQLEKRRNKK